MRELEKIRGAVCGIATRTSNARGEGSDVPDDSSVDCGGHSRPKPPPKPPTRPCSDAVIAAIRRRRSACAVSGGAGSRAAPVSGAALPCAVAGSLVGDRGRDGQWTVAVSGQGLTVSGRSQSMDGRSQWTGTVSGRFLSVAVRQWQSQRSRNSADGRPRPWNSVTSAAVRDERCNSRGSPSGRSSLMARKRQHVVPSREGR